MASSSMRVRLLAYIFLLLTLVDAVALPNNNIHIHKVETLGARHPDTANKDVAVTLDDAKEPKDFLKAIGDFFSQYSLTDIVRSLFGKSLKGDANPLPSSVATTVIVAPTPTAIAVASSSVALNLSATKSAVTVTRVTPVGLASPVPIPSSLSVFASLPTPVVSIEVTAGIKASASIEVPASAIEVSTAPTLTPEEEESVFTILPYYSPEENLTNNITYPEPTELPVISDDFPNEPTLAGITDSAYPEPTETALPSEIEEFEEEEEEAGNPVSSILPSYPPGVSITTKITYSEPTGLPLLSESFPNEPTLAGTIDPFVPAPTESGVPSELEDFEEDGEQVSSISPSIPLGESLSLSATTSEPTGVLVVTEPEEPVITGIPTPTDIGDEDETFSVLPFLLPGENLTDNVTYPTGIEEPAATLTSLPEDMDPEVGDEVEDPDQIFSILPYLPSGANLTDEVSYTSPIPIATLSSEELPSEPTLIDPDTFGAEGLPNTISSPVIPTRFPTPALSIAPLSGPEIIVARTGTSTITRTRPWLYTNPLRPTDDPAAAIVSGDASVSVSVRSSSVPVVSVPRVSAPAVSIPVVSVPSVSEEKTTTTTIHVKSTKLVFVTVIPTPVGPAVLSVGGSASVPTPTGSAVLSIGGLTSAISTLRISLLASPTTLPSLLISVSGKASASTVVFTPVIPIPTFAAPADSGVYAADALKSLRDICQDPKVKTITLPLLNKFYGQNAYPSLNKYPGCSPANPHQAIQAPGLLNCSLLGTEVQTCQKAGRRVLLSVSLDSPLTVGGNLNYGKPAGSKPGVFPLPIPLPRPSGTFPGRPKLPPIWPLTNWTAIKAGNTTHNLFDATHPPSSFALTLFSLFGSGHTERADLRPLGPDASAWDGIKFAIDRPLGEEVIVDGFDVKVPGAWKGTFEGDEIAKFVARLRELEKEAWKEGGARRGGPLDLGADGPGVVVVGYQ